MLTTCVGYDFYMCTCLPWNIKYPPTTLASTGLVALQLYEKFTLFKLTKVSMQIVSEIIQHLPLTEPFSLSLFKSLKMFKILTWSNLSA